MDSTGNTQTSPLDQVIGHVNHLCGQLIEPVCCTKFIKNFEFQDPVCLATFATKALGYSIVLGASAVKLPQVFKLLGARSGAGITVFGVLFELLAITFNACYSYRNNFPFSAWGEAIFLALETALIAFLVLWFDNKKPRALLFSILYAATIAILVHPNLVPLTYMWWLQSTVLPLAVSGKLMQAIKNFKSKHTGHLSAVTAWAMLSGSLTRIYTTIQETNDLLTAITFAFSAAANAVIAIQVLYYWTSTKNFLDKGKKKKNN